MKIIPAIDIINGECVRLTKGDYEAKKSYFKNPLEAAKRFEDYGFTRLHVVDLEGAKSGEIKNLKTLENICSNTSLIVDFGGGVKSTSALESALAAGASFVTCGSIAVKNPSLVLSWLEKYNDKLILGADCKNRMIATFGWLETSDIEPGKFMKQLASCYAIYFNRKYRFSGHLFEGRYKACLVKDDDYFLQSSRYIHLNPVKAGIVEHPED